MSYCITQDEIDRRGICADASCTPPLTIRETIIEPLLTEPLFESDPFLPSFIGGGGGRGRRRPWQKPSWRPGKASWRRPVGGGGTPTTSIMQPRGSTTNYVADTGKANVTRSVVSRGPEYHVSSPGYARVTRSVSPSYQASTQSTARVFGKALKGLGQISIETGVSPRWKWAALGLVGLLGVQFWWWQRRCPNVLKSYFK